MEISEVLRNKIKEAMKEKSISALVEAYFCLRDAENVISKWVDYDHSLSQPSHRVCERLISLPAANLKELELKYSVLRRAYKDGVNDGDDLLVSIESDIKRLAQEENDYEFERREMLEVRELERLVELEDKAAADKLKETR